LDPINWPSGAGTVVLVVWLAYAVASNVWLYPLIWTVLPTGMTLYLRAKRYSWRAILIFVLPLTSLTAFSQVAGTWFLAPTSVAFAIYLAACALFALVVTDPQKTYERVPAWLLGEPFATRLVGARFEDASEAANELVRRINANEDPGSQKVEINRLAAEARRESRRNGTWREAWATHAAWWEALAGLLDAEPTDEGFRQLNHLVVEANEAERLAIERAKALDPAGTSP
jgi:hypothetical protein